MNFYLNDQLYVLYNQQYVFYIVVLNIIQSKNITLLFHLLLIAFV